MKKLNLVIFSLFVGVTQASAASSPWFDTDGARIRLISMPSPDGKTIEAGLQFQLQPDWKTYWRAPGASGLPPQVSFLGSENTSKVEMSLPTPELFVDGNGVSAGYKNAVTFPIKVETQTMGKPVKIKANGLVGICGTICVPVQFQLELTENGNGAVPADIARALFSARSNITKPSHSKQNVQEVIYDAAMKKLVVKTKVPNGTTKASLFIEGPFNWYLSPVKHTKLDGETAQFLVDLTDMPKDTKPEDVSLRLTLVANGQGVEQEMKPQRR